MNKKAFGGTGKIWSLIIHRCRRNFGGRWFYQCRSRLFDTILKLREKGIQFAVASGRPWASVERTFDPVKKKVFYSSNNGSYIGCYGRSLYVYAMDREIVKRLIHAVRKNPEFSMVYAAEDGDYTESKDDALCNWLVESYKFNLHRVDDLPAVTGSMYQTLYIQSRQRGRSSKTSGRRI